MSTTESLGRFESRVRGDAPTDPPVSCQQYIGKYRGTVINNVDPLGKGRIMASVPDVQGVIPGTWASPCLPHGSQVTPMIGSGVWIEFEQGDPDHPIWTGAIAGTVIDLPVAAKLTPPGVPQTTIASPIGQNSITVSDSPTTGVIIKGPGAMLITMNAAGITLANGTSSIVITPAGIAITGLVTVT
jgi:hypothetical protein